VNADVEVLVAATVAHNITIIIDISVLNQTPAEAARPCTIDEPLHHVA